MKTSLIQFNIDITRVADSLERLVFLVEKLVFPPPPPELKVQQATLDDLHTVSPEDLARIQAEQMEFAERFRVVPGSPAMMQALADWEAEQRSLYGEAWEAPQDWRSILAAAERTRPLGEQPEAAGTAGPRDAGQAAESGAR
jgi:hypothetical protein